MPTSIRTLLRRCLQKDPSLRLRDIGDARIEIGELATQPSETLSAPRRFSLLWLAAGAVVVLLAGIAAGLLLIRYFQQTPSASAVKAIIKVEPGHWLEGGRRTVDREQPSLTAMAVASDGRFIAYSAIPENPAQQAKPQIYLRRMDEMDAAPVPGTEGGINPFL